MSNFCCSWTIQLFGIMFLLMASAKTSNAATSDSDSVSQQQKESEVPSILDCSAGSSSASSPASTSTTTAPSSSSSISTTSVSSPSTPSSSSSSSASSNVTDTAASSTPSSSSSTSSISSATSSSPSSSTAANASSSSTSTPSSPTTASNSSTTESYGSSTSASNSSAEPCPCVLIQELVNLKLQYLNNSQQSVFDKCLDDIRTVLVNNANNSSSNATVQQKASQIALLLKNCFAENPDIKDLLKFKQIASWGRIYEFLAAGISFDSANIDPLIIVDNSTGECNLTQALVNGTTGDVCGTNSSAEIEALTQKANIVLAKQISGYDKGRKLGWLAKVFKKHLFAQHPEYEQCVRNNVSIEGFGSFDQFLSVCDQLETTSSLGSGVLNSTTSNSSSSSGVSDDCALVKSLNESLNNANSTSNSTDSATLDEANKYVSNLTNYFAENNDIATRLEFVSAQFSLLSSACRLLLYPIQIVGTYLSIDFSDILVASNFCADDGCGNITAGSASLSWPETCIIDSAQNISDIERADDDYYANLTAVQKTQFNSYKNSISNCIRSSSYGTNNSARYECVQTYVQNYASNNRSTRATFLAVEVPTVLVENATNVQFGTFGDICGCN